MRAASSLRRVAAACARRARAIGAAGRALRSVLGVPDYERYLAHVRERHPGAQPISRDDFVAARLQARYERPGSRCC